MCGEHLSREQRAPTQPSSAHARVHPQSAHGQALRGHPQRLRPCVCATSSSHSQTQTQLTAAARQMQDRAAFSQLSPTDPCGAPRYRIGAVATLQSPSKPPAPCLFVLSVQMTDVLAPHASDSPRRRAHFRPRRRETRIPHVTLRAVGSLRNPRCAGTLPAWRDLARAVRLLLLPRALPFRLPRRERAHRGFLSQVASFLCPRVLAFPHAAASARSFRPRQRAMPRLGPSAPAQAPSQGHRAATNPHPAVVASGSLPHRRVRFLVWPTPTAPRACAGVQWRPKQHAGGCAPAALSPPQPPPSASARPRPPPESPSASRGDQLLPSMPREVCVQRRRHRSQMPAVAAQFAR
eukprot:Opistho-2@53406